MNAYRILSALLRAPTGRTSAWAHHGLRLFLALLVAAAAVGTFQFSPATATHTDCPTGTLPVHFTPPVDSALRVWDVEGRISAYTAPNRSITANGMTLYLPLGLLVKTIDLAQPVGNLEFAESANPAMLDLVDPALEAVRTIVGGTVIADGETVFTTTPGGTCMRLVATSVFVELAENGLIGLLMSVNEAAGSLVVNGTTIKMNTDPRFPSDLLDLGGSPITIADLVGNEGALITVGGYYDAAAGLVYGTVVEAEVLIKQVGKDTVLIEKAQRQQTRLRVVGLVSRHPVTNLFAPSVDIFPGAMTADGSGCQATTALGTAPVDPADGTFDFRQNVSGVLTKVCAASPNGGVDDADVVSR